MIDHVGLEVRDYRRSKDFYLAALAGYYGAFVRDPDGNTVEAVHHGG